MPTSVRRLITHVPQLSHVPVCLCKRDPVWTAQSLCAGFPENRAGLWTCLAPSGMLKWRLSIARTGKRLVLIMEACWAGREPTSTHSRLLSDYVLPPSLPSFLSAHQVSLLALPCLSTLPNNFVFSNSFLFPSVWGPSVAPPLLPCFSPSLSMPFYLCLTIINSPCYSFASCPVHFTSYSFACFSSLSLPSSHSAFPFITAFSRLTVGLFFLFGFLPLNLGLRWKSIFIMCSDDGNKDESPLFTCFRRVVLLSTISQIF